MIVNLRDVGKTINELSGKHLLKENVLYRGGAITANDVEEHLPRVRTIINLRVKKDPLIAGTNQLHIPAIDTLDNYYTDNPQIRAWVCRVLRSIGNNSTSPVLIHCTAGKDRTGVITALILKLLGIPESVIVEDYMMSEGVHGSSSVHQALHGFGDPEAYVYDAGIPDSIRSLMM